MNRMPPQLPIRVGVNNTPATAKRGAHSLLWLMLLCGVVVAAGFARATAQHVAAINYGYQCEAMRGEQARLLAEQKQLRLALGEAAAPRHLEQAARGEGLVVARGGQFKNEFNRERNFDSAENNQTTGSSPTTSNRSGVPRGRTSSRDGEIIVVTTGR